MWMDWVGIASNGVCGFHWIIGSDGNKCVRDVNGNMYLP